MFKIFNAVHRIFFNFLRDLILYLNLMKIVFENCFEIMKLNEIVKSYVLHDKIYV